jgi:hypothetical protein
LWTSFCKTCLEAQGLPHSLPHEPHKPHTYSISVRVPYVSRAFVEDNASVLLGISSSSSHFSSLFADSTAT